MALAHALYTNMNAFNEGRKAISREKQPYLDHFINNPHAISSFISIVLLGLITPLLTTNWHDIVLLSKLGTAVRSPACSNMLYMYHTRGVILPEKVINDVLYNVLIIY